MRRFSEKQWDQMLERLKAYKKTHGHCLVPRRYSLDPKLGSWVHSQRKGSLNPKKKVDWNQFRDNVESFRLLEDRRRRLDAIGFAWSCRPEPCNESPQDEENQDVDRWDNMFSQLQAYKERYGNCSVPKRFSENPKLATWVDNQRVKMKKMKNKLAEEGIIYDENRVDDESQTSTTEAAVGRLVQERIRRLNSIGKISFQRAT